ncbi:HlyD family efflux transporter periplasmic adaptor subunit [Gilliamella sp. App4-10]|uniref:HlyD family efflux transporter periplasmic adaptor subunit n=1 Tax=Gilliamella sp. App4-10 TaxID=3120231 RepID=UPI00080E8AFF|nr:HlyD family efflux transporter periplasmic adaptor subunit [Gilliamella apicola]OCG20513.1 hypothetical protein A9G23_06735 [Gilliamella apicola]
MTIVAPKGGIISTIMVSKGQSIGYDVIIATLFSEDPTLEANLFIPSSAIGFIKVGLPVSIRYDAFPYQKFGQQKGIINKISSNTLYLNKLKSLSIYSQQFNNEKAAYYRVKVKLDNQDILAYGKNYHFKSGDVFRIRYYVRKKEIEKVLDIKKPARSRS